MKQKPKPKDVAPRLLRRGEGSPLHHKVKRMAAAGLVEDQIALRLGGIDKNRLRKNYIDEIKEGRAVAAAREEKAAAEALSKAEARRLAVIEASFASDWYTPEHGNDLYGGTHSVEDALAWLKQMGFNKLDHW